MFGKRHLPVVISSLALTLLAVLILSTPRPTYAAVSCTSAASGAWSIPSTWMNCNNGFPGAGDSATINSGHTVTLTETVKVKSVTVSGTLDVATFTLTLTGGGTLSVAGTVQGAGKVRMEGTTTLAATGAFNVAVEVASGTTTAYGTLGSTLTVATVATLSVSSSSSLTVKGDVTLNGTLSGNDSSFYFAGATFTNTGSTTVRSFYVQGAAPTLTGAGAWSGVRLYIYGPTAAGTTTALGGPLTLSNGSLTIGDNAGADTLNLAGFDLTLIGGSLTVVSNGTLAGAGSTVHTLGAVSLDSSVFSPALAVDSGVTMAQGTFGGTISVAADATLQAGISSSCGTLTANGNVTVNGVLSNYPGYACTLVFNGLTFTNNGAVTVSYTDFYGSGSQSVGGTGTWTGIYLTIGSSSTTLLAN
ncbi:MAG: hypothetical protein NT169_17255, partial [Chloroflexi bacterium]|nr:hypothetical protein [Chloroflexota bacterium]